MIDHKERMPQVRQRAFDCAIGMATVELHNGMLPNHPLEVAVYVNYGVGIDGDIEREKIFNQEMDMFIAWIDFFKEKMKPIQKIIQEGLPK